MQNPNQQPQNQNMSVEEMTVTTIAVLELDTSNARDWIKCWTTIGMLMFYSACKLSFMVDKSSNDVFVLLVLVATYYSLSVVDMAMIAEIGLLDPFLDVVFQEKNWKMIFFAFDCA
jgi:hypothetical protein